MASAAAVDRLPGLVPGPDRLDAGPTTSTTPVLLPLALKEPSAETLAQALLRAGAEPVLPQPKHLQIAEPGGLGQELPGRVGDTVVAQAQILQLSEGRAF